MMGPVAKSPDKSRGASAGRAGKAAEPVPAQVASHNAGKGGGDDANGSATRGAKERTRPESVTGSTRVNVAFPLSKIVLQEPTAELVELVALLSDLLAALAEWIPEDTLAELRSRAESLAARLAP